MKRPRKSTWARLSGLAMLVFLAIAVVAGVITAQRIQPRLASARIGMAQVESMLSGDPASLVRLVQDPGQLAVLESALATLDDDLEALDRLARPYAPLAPLLAWVPSIGGDVAAAPDLLSLAHYTTRAATALVSGLGPLASRLQQTEAGLGSAIPELLAGLAEANPNIQEAQAALGAARQARAGIRTNRLSSRTLRIVDRLDRYRPLLELSAQALSTLPGLVGAHGPRSYLVVAQNNQELRATGGFISGVGLLRVDNGRIADLRFQDSYAVDNLGQPHPLPPAPLRRYMKAGMLVLRDANWWPDFPTSAKQIAELYRQDQGVTTDGVIAADLTTLRLLVEAVGPIEVPGYQPTVSSDNLQGMLMSFWEAPRLLAPGDEGTDWWARRKDFASDLMSALLAHVMERTTAADWTALAQAVSQAIRQRHLLMVVQDPQGEALLRQLGADGAIYPTEGDYLQVVDSNIGFNKVNPNIEQTLDYEVVMEPTGGDSARLTVTYRHRIERPSPACVHELRYGDSYADLMERCYWDYLRIYVPAGSQMIDLQGSDAPVESYEESGKAVIATAFLLETGQARRIQLSYRPAAPLTQHNYSLLVQKQAGSGALPLRVSVALPRGARPTHARPSEWLWVDGKVVWQTTLDQDREFTLSWK